MGPGNLVDETPSGTRLVAVVRKGSEVISRAQIRCPEQYLVCRSFQGN